MKLSQIIIEGKRPVLERNNSYLYEGLSLTEAKSMNLWENAGRQLYEANLTKDQILQLFADVEQGATAGGANRTALGKGKDAATAVNKAWEDLKTKIQDSGPVKAVDQKYDDAIAKIEAGLGGPDNKVNQVIQRYRKFAKEHPVAQGFVYAALIAAAGISGAGLGGAAVLGLLKMSDKLLQGEKFSSAAYAGAKTGILAFAASQVGDYIKDKFATYTTENTYYVNGQEVDKATYEATMKGIQSDLAKKGIDFEKGTFDKTAVDAVVKDNLSDVPAGGGIKAPDFDPGVTTQKFSGTMVANEPVIPGQPLSPTQVAVTDMSISMGNKPNPVVQAAYDLAKKSSQTQSREYLGKKLSEGQVYLLFKRTEVAQVYLAEAGLLSKVGGAIKGAASKLGQKITTKGKNLTTKVTADKLNSAWQKAGSPTDSEEIFDFLTQQGVNKEVIAPVYDTMKLPVPKSAAQDEPADAKPEQPGQDAGTATQDQAADQPEPSATDQEQGAADSNQQAKDKPAKGQEVTLSGKKYQWLGAQWAEVNPETGKAGKVAEKGIVKTLNDLAGVGKSQDKPAQDAKPGTVGLQTQPGETPQAQSGNTASGEKLAPAATQSQDGTAPKQSQQIDIVTLATEIKSSDPDITSDVKRLLDDYLKADKKAAPKEQPKQDPAAPAAA